MPLHSFKIPSPEAIFIVPSIMPLYAVPELTSCMRVCVKGVVSQNLFPLSPRELSVATARRRAAYLDRVDWVHDGVFLREEKMAVSGHVK